MLEVRIPSVGPEAEAPRQSPEKGHMVFRVEVQYRGRRHTVPRRYSEFHALHKRIKKLYKVPEFPSKRLPNWRARGLEHRRQGLEAYIQGILYLNPDVPKELLEFLNLRHFPTDSKASSWRDLGKFLPNDSSLQLLHQPVIGFCRDPFTCISSPGSRHGEVTWLPGLHSSPAWCYQTNVNLEVPGLVSEPLPNVVVNGVLQGFYGFCTSPADAQPEAPRLPAPWP